MQTGKVDVEGAGEFFLELKVESTASENKEALFERLIMSTVIVTYPNNLGIFWHSITANVTTSCVWCLDTLWQQRSDFLSNLISSTRTHPHFCQLQRRKRPAKASAVPPRLRPSLENEKAGPLFFFFFFTKPKGL